MIRHATPNDYSAIEAIARQHPDELSYIPRAWLAREQSNGELLVAEFQGEVAGFVRFHACRDGWSTLYDMGVRRDFQGQGIGRALLYSVPCPIRLDVTADNERANAFYRGAGMSLVRTEAGRKRPLNVYQMNMLYIIVRGDNKRVPDICRKVGAAYGAQERNKPSAWPFMADVEFEKPDWPRYLEFIRRWQPAQALVVDYFSPDDKAEMLSQVDDLRTAGVLRVVVCVKFNGAVKDIPADCIIGVSLRTKGRMTKGNNKFAGFMPDFAELIGRRCHLLGGSPALQKRTIAEIAGHGGRVISVDGNAQFGAAGTGSIYGDGLWNRQEGVKVSYWDAALMSSRNIQRELNSVGQLKQLPLF